MPAKGRRIASRQAQLGRRRRQQNRKTEESLAVSVAAPADIPAETAGPANAAASNPAAAEPARSSTAGSAAAPARAPRRPAAGQTRTDRSAAYTHLGSEMRRILILAGILLAVLVGLSFVI